MKAALALIGLAALSTAAAQDIGGTYSVEGANPSGSPYRGTAEIVVTSRNTCRITWSTGSTSQGICMRNENAFTAAYALGDKIGLVIYELKPDGSMEGLWTIADQNGIGREVLTPQQ